MSEDYRKNLSTKQQQMLEHIQRAKQLGQTLSDYCREHGLKQKALYNYHWLLRKKGIIKPSADTPSFVKVKTPTNRPPSPGIICTIYFPNGIHMQVNSHDNSLFTLLHQVQSL